MRRDRRFGAEPESVFARAAIHPRFRVDVSAHMLIEFPGGRFAQCDCAFDAQYQSRLLVVGEAGTLGLDRAFSAKHHEVKIRVVKGDRHEDIPVPAANMYTRMVEHFGGCVLEKKPLRYAAGDAEGNMRVIDACFESMRTGFAVPL